MSSLCTTSPCAACRINSSKAGSIRSALAWTMSHWVEAGKGMPRFSCSPFQAMERHPAAVLQQSNHAARRRVVLLLANSVGRLSREDLPQRLQRNFCNS